MTTDSGDFEGIDIEVADAIAKKLGLELQVDDMDFDAALLAAQNGKSDIVMAGVTVDEDRLAVMDFTTSYANGVQVVIVPEDSEIASIDDLEGKADRLPAGAPPAISSAPTPRRTAATVRRTSPPMMTAPPPSRRCSTARWTRWSSTMPPPRSM